MPTFRNDLPPTTDHHAYTLYRTPADQQVTCIVTSPQLIVCDTHYWGGRTIPHEPDDCPACAAGVPYRTHAYVACIRAKTREHCLFEFTATAAAPLQEYQLANSTLRGCLFTAYRPQRRKNAKVQIDTRPADLTRVNLPNPPDVVKALCVIWRVPAPTADPAEPHNKPSRLALDRDQMAKLHGRNGRRKCKPESMPS